MGRSGSALNARAALRVVSYVLRSRRASLDAASMASLGGIYELNGRRARAKRPCGRRGAGGAVLGLP